MAASNSSTTQKLPTEIISQIAYDSTNAIFEDFRMRLNEIYDESQHTYGLYFPWKYIFDPDLSFQERIQRKETINQYANAIDQLARASWLFRGMVTKACTLHSKWAQQNESDATAKGEVRGDSADISDEVERVMKCLGH